MNRLRSAKTNKPGMSLVVPAEWMSKDKSMEISDSESDEDDPHCTSPYAAMDRRREREREEDELASSMSASGSLFLRACKAKMYDPCKNHLRWVLRLLLVVMAVVSLWHLLVLTSVYGIHAWKHPKISFLGDISARLSNPPHQFDKVTSLDAPTPRVASDLPFVQVRPPVVIPLGRSRVEYLEFTQHTPMKWKSLKERQDGYYPFVTTVFISGQTDTDPNTAFRCDSGCDRSLPQIVAGATSNDRAQTIGIQYPTGDYRALEDAIQSMPEKGLVLSGNNDTSSFIWVLHGTAGVDFVRFYLHKANRVLDQQDSKEACNRGTDDVACMLFQHTHNIIFIDTPFYAGGDLAYVPNFGRGIQRPFQSIAQHLDLSGSPASHPVRPLAPADVLFFANVSEKRNVELDCYWAQNPIPNIDHLPYLWTWSPGNTELSIYLLYLPIIVSIFLAAVMLCMLGWWNASRRHLTWIGPIGICLLLFLIWYGYIPVSTYTKAADLVIRPAVDRSSALAPCEISPLTDTWRPNSHSMIADHIGVAKPGPHDFRLVTLLAQYMKARIQTTRDRWITQQQQQQQQLQQSSSSSSLFSLIGLGTDSASSAPGHIGYNERLEIGPPSDDY